MLPLAWPDKISHGFLKAEWDLEQFEMGASSFLNHPYLWTMIIYVHHSRRRWFLFGT
jgi:hypothetical protein